MSQAILIKACTGHEGRESAPAAVSVEFQFINFESAQKLMKTNIVGMSELGSTNDLVRISRCASHVDFLISAICPFVHDFFFCLSFRLRPHVCRGLLMLSSRPLASRVGIWTGHDATRPKYNSAATSRSVSTAPDWNRFKHE